MTGRADPGLGDHVAVRIQPLLERFDVRAGGTNGERAGEYV